MSQPSSPGQRFRQAVAEESPLQVVGAINANHALLAQRAGFKAIYLSGGGVAAGSLGLPDLGITGLDDVLTDVRRITCHCWWMSTPGSARPPSTWHARSSR
jgi:methylisocitrate lyase